MVQISNKPNINGIKNASEDADYSSKLIAREGKLFAGLLATRTQGFAIGILFSCYFTSSYSCYCKIMWNVEVFIYE